MKRIGPFSLCVFSLTVLLSVLACDSSGTDRGTLPGDLDGSFGSGGMVRGKEPSSSLTVSSAFVNVSAVNGIVVGGAAGDSSSGFGLFSLRLSSSGAVLSSTEELSAPAASKNVHGIAVDAAGGVVFAGNESNGTDTDFYRAKHLIDNSLDTSFSSGRDDLQASDEEARAVVEQSDGKLYAAGFSTAVNRQFALVRYTGTGARDTSFGTGGLVETGIGSQAEAYGVFLPQDGSLSVILVGMSSDGISKNMTLASYDSSGNLNTFFGPSGTGVYTLDYNDYDQGDPAETNEDTTDDILNAAAAGQWSYDQFVAVGSTQPLDGSVQKCFLLARFNTPWGSIDTNFGYQGRIKTYIGNKNAEATSVAVDSYSRILAAGWVENAEGGTDIVLARYYSTGILDPDFGQGGYVVTELGSGVSSAATSVGIQTDGKIVVGGITSEGEYIVLRYHQ